MWGIGRDSSGIWGEIYAKRVTVGHLQSLVKSMIHRALKHGAK